LLYSLALPFALTRTVLHPLIPLAALAVSYGSMLLRFGWPAHGGDTPRILQEAANLSAGRPLGPTGTTFLLPHVIFAAIDRLGLPLQAYVIVQILLSAVAACALLGLVRLAGGDRLAGIIASTAWALNPLAQQWNVYLLSDGLYQSLIIITAYSLARALNGRRASWILMASLCTLSACVTRPQGQLWPAIVCVLLLIHGGRSALTWIAVAATLVLQAALVAMGREYATHMNMVQYLTRGQVIWGYSDYLMAMPPAAGGDTGGLRSVVEYVVSHPVASAKLAAARVLVEMSNVRPFYSPIHNVISALFYWPLYVLAALGLRDAAASPARTVCVLVFVSHLAFVGITHADWDGRWFLQVLPFLLAWGSMGAVSRLALVTARMRTHAD
jgi:hypothetical protein